MKMDVFFGVLLVIFILLALLWPYVSKWIGPVVQRWMVGRFEDQMRRMAGMPTRKEERKMRKKAEKQRRAAGEADGWSAFRNRRSSAPGPGAKPIIPKEYAEDVEFVEVKSYSEQTEIKVEDTGSGSRIVEESQIEDAEYIEIKENKQ